MGKKHKLFEEFEWPEPEDDYEADRSNFSDPFSNFDSFINACDQSKSQASDEEETDVESIPFARTYLWKGDDSDDEEDTVSSSEESSAAQESQHDLPFMIERFEKTSSDTDEPDEEDRVSFGSYVSAQLFDNAGEDEEDESEPDREFAEQIASIKQQITGIVPIKPVVAATVKNENAKRQTLQDMQAALQLAVPIIYHNGGLYYYNGRTYSAIGSSPDLLAIIRQKVSHTGFSCASTKQFAELFNYMLADKERLAPVHYSERLAQSKYMVVLKNGVLDMETLRLISHSPRYLTFHELDAEWTDDEPEIFNKFLEEISGGNKQIKRRMKEVLGCLLSGQQLKAFFIMGTAANSGKSTLGRLLHRLLGDDKVCSISTYQLSERFALGGTRNKVLCLAMDIPNGYLNRTAVSIIKSISGGDSITIEMKYEHPQYIVSGMRFLFGSNYPLTIPREFDEDAFWDRMIILPFLFSIPRDQADMNLLEKMLDEKDAIVSDCLRTYRRVIKNNCQFSACDAADEMKAEWRGNQADSFSFQSFWQRQIEVTGNAENELYAGDLYDAYVRYCQQNNQTPISHANMKAWIRQNIDPRLCYEKRLHKTNSNPRAGYVGIHLSTQE